jgi:hypothetical protein
VNPCVRFGVDRTHGVVRVPVEQVGVVG